jgi:adenylate cyclase
MESHSEHGQIQVSETTYWRLRERYELSCRGTIDVKGLGRVETYFLLGKKVEPRDTARMPALFTPADDTWSDREVAAYADGIDAQVAFEPDP